MESVLSLSNLMLSSARNQNWDAVVELEARRQGLINDIDFKKISNEKLAGVAVLLRQILATDQELIKLAEQQQVQIKSTLQTLNIGRRLEDVYQTGE